METGLNLFARVVYMYLDDEVAGKNIAEMEKSGKIAMDHGNNVHNFEQTWVNIDDADFCFCF